MTPSTTPPEPTATPRTDAVEKLFGEMPGEMRKLETQLTAAQAELAELRRERDDYRHSASQAEHHAFTIAQNNTKLKAERDAARREIERLNLVNNMLDDGRLQAQLAEERALVEELGNDAKRLDHIQITRTSLLTVHREVYHPKTDGSMGVDIESIFLGFTMASRMDELPTVREAIDLARAERSRMTTQENTVRP